MAAADTRVVAVEVIKQLQTQGGTLTSLLPAAQQRVPEADQALLQALCYGLARWSVQLREVVDQLLDKPLKRKDLDVYLVLQIGILQLAHMRIASHAAVNLTVQCAVKLGKPWARGLINAVLRNYQRRADELEVELSDAARSAHPLWMLDTFKKDWPADWAAIVRSGNRQAPMTLRVNTQRQSRTDYLQRLQQAGMAASCHPYAIDALVLSVPVAVERLPGFMQGDVSVQDAAAQLAARFLQRQDGICTNEFAGRMLDACAAPGGKTAHLLELAQWRSVTAIDRDPVRLNRLEATLDRLQLKQPVTLVSADAADLEQWWDQQQYSAVLLDAPCTGTGVIRRHPDIKMLRRANDVAPLLAAQQRLLDTLWRVVAPGGCLLYATCSILQAENAQQISQFVARTPDACCVGLDESFGQSVSMGLQILPGVEDMDGFYYAMLVKDA